MPVSVTSFNPFRTVSKVDLEIVNWLSLLMFDENISVLSVRLTFFTKCGWYNIPPFAKTA